MDYSLSIWFRLVVVLNFFISTSISQQLVTVAANDESANPCISARQCGECIQIFPLCAWCGAEMYSKDLPRCNFMETLKKTCDLDLITNPQSFFEVLRNDDLTSGSADKSPIQLQPQAVKFSLRPNEPKKFKLKFQQQANYPVDLYFLLDLSYGMHRQAEAQKRLIALGNDIPGSMAAITNNFRLGFGTFVDKNVMPFTAWTDQMLKDRCPIAGGRCRYPHDFRNQLSLGSNQSSFASSMREALRTVSQSLDDAEGGLDGLVQALNCDIIGWRPVSRRIVVYSSNSLFHLAGDGKLGGATKQNRLKCSLTDDGLYADDRTYDYPSIGQIGQVLKDNKANVIFAVMGNVADHYRSFVHFLDSAVVGQLEDDSNNIVGLIKDKYYELRSRIEFHPLDSSNVNVKLESKCKGDILKETSYCDNIEIMDSVEFDVTVLVDKNICNGKTGSVNKEVFLNAVGLNERVGINLEVQCGCDCENTSANPAIDNTKCTNGNGGFECGICRCNPGRFGRVCECDESQISQNKSIESCRENRDDGLICSGNGECICGVCECLPLPGDPTHSFTGRFCQCNDFSCRRDENKLLCGGSSRGTCQCGVCECLSGWTGKSCDCTTDESSCIASDGTVCNGVGVCQCGRCSCNATSGMIGPTCEDCLTCPSQCNEYIDCAQCKGFQSGALNEKDCQLNCDQLIVRKVSNLPSGEGIRTCEGTDVDACSFYFTYQYNADNSVLLNIQHTKSCPKKVNKVAIIGGTVSAVVLIPLVLIILFILIRNWKDRQEYAKFVKCIQNAHWDSGSNPLYDGPTTSYTNYNYQGNKKANDGGSANK